MSVPIVIFFHGLFVMGNPPEPLPQAIEIIHEQMTTLKTSGLEAAASEIHCGINGGPESEVFAKALLPAKAQIVYHGLQCRTENRTILMIEEWCRANPGEAYILSFHSKGASHAADSDYGNNMSKPWRNRMMLHCVRHWPQCVSDLAVHEAVGCHWLTGQGWDRSQHYFAGTFAWFRASFFRTIPSIMTRQRIKDSGLDLPESRYEAEVVLGNGPRLPVVKDYYSGAIGT